MYGGRDAEINDRVGRTLLDVLPPYAAQVTANAIVGEDRAEVGFAHPDAAGNPGSFDFDNTPSRAGVTSARR